MTEHESNGNLRLALTLLGGFAGLEFAHHSSKAWVKTGSRIGSRTRRMYSRRRGQTLRWCVCGTGGAR